MAAMTFVVVLALTFAAAQAKRGHIQCDKYTWQERQEVLWLLRGMKHAPVGPTTVRCSEKEKDCLLTYRIRMPDGSCQMLGANCTQQNGTRGMVRASLAEWRAARRLVGECAPLPRYDHTHVLVRPRWFSPAELSVQAGHLLCACALLVLKDPVKPFPGFDCLCDGAPKLRLAPFGGYECVRTCKYTCSPQPTESKGLCVFPPLAVDSFAVLYATNEFLQPKKRPQDVKGRVLKPAPPNNDDDDNVLDIEGSQIFHRYLPRYSYETP